MLLLFVNNYSSFTNGLVIMVKLNGILFLWSFEILLISILLNPFYYCLLELEIMVDPVL